MRDWRPDLIFCAMVIFFIATSMCFWMASEKLDRLLARAPVVCK